jgi:methylmalonyl-CoA mutase
MAILDLDAEFPVATRERWLKLVEGAIKGADFRKTLVSRSHEGIEIDPLYPKAEAAGPILPARAGHWRVAQRVDHPDPAIANELLIADLQGGAGGLTLVFQGAPTARGFGLELAGLADLERVLGGVMLDLIELALEPASFTAHLTAALVTALVAQRGLDPATLSVDFGLDPIGDLARTGSMPASKQKMLAQAAEASKGLRKAGFSGPMWRADARPYHEAGAGEAQELAAVIATGLAYLRAEEASGSDLSEARRALSFLLAADADEFLTVAKFRALRRLWARVEEACGLEPAPIRLTGETAWRMVTRRDPWVNLLRTSVAAFSAGIGGADSVCILPFTAALGLADPFARRLARNAQLILLEESNLWRVADPAAGAGGFEALTDALCERAWALFQEIEREGGIIDSLETGALQGRIATVRLHRERAVATRKDPLTGTSAFPDLAEKEVTTLPVPPSRKRSSGPFLGQDDPFATLVEAAKSGAGLPEATRRPQAIEPLPTRRDAEPFERFRDLSDAHLARSGSRPRIFLATLGPVAAFTPRATFAKSFFEAGGIETVANEGAADVEAIAKAYLGSKAKIICLCSSDEIYREQAISAIMTLRKLTTSPIYLAGRPGEFEEPLRRAGTSTFIYAGCDILEVLEGALNAACA